VRKLAEKEVNPFDVSPSPSTETPFKCPEEFFKKLALETEMVPEEERPQKALEAMEAVLRERRSVATYLDTCTKCGACAERCHYYIGTEDPFNMPAHRVDLFRKVYKKHFTIGGKLLGSVVGAEEMSNKVLEEWYKYFYSCSECRRCSIFCPFGIDTAEITMAAREIMLRVGLGTKYTNEVIAKVYEVGNNLGIPELAFWNNIGFCAEEIKDMMGIEIKFPGVKENPEDEMAEPKVGAEILYVPPSADLFVNIDTQIGAMLVFHAADADYTMSHLTSEAANFGIFQDYADLKTINKRIVDEAHRLGVKKVVFGECGNAWRAAKNITETWNGPLNFEFEHVLQYTEGLIREGKITLDKSRVTELVTLHDPCNYARGSGLLDPQRYILSQAVTNFKEMAPDKIREYTFCCGGGGGMLMDELMDLRMKGAKPRAEAVRDVGAKYLAAPCAICKAQLRLVMDHYKLDTDVGGVLDLVARAIVIEGAKVPGEAAAPAGKTKCSICDAEFASFDECAEHAEKEHQISKDQADMCCELK
jgi:Fe-S oxidoreductase